MSWIDKVRQAELKTDTFWTQDDVRFGRYLPRSDYSFGADIEEGLDSNVVMSPVSWIMRTFTEAEPMVESQRNARWQPVVDHRLTEQLANPNAFYDGDTLWKATIASYCLEGDGYWVKIRNKLGEVLEYWYVPHWMIRPWWPGNNRVYIDHYKYNVEGDEIELPPRDVVHFRFGLDPRNTRHGFSPLRPLLREVFTDEEAANFSAAILRNMGVPGLIVSPKDANAVVKKEAAEEMKDRLRQHFTRDKRGEPFVATGPTDVKQFGFDPNQLMLGNLRDITEERVCAMLGIPAAVVGFGAGLQQTKVGATMRELVRLARVNCINPMARSLAKQLTKQVMGDYQAQSKRFRVRFDMSDVSVFQEDETQREERILKRVEGGVLRVDHAQDMLGLEVDESQAIYLRKTELQAVPANKKPEEPSGNGRPPDEAEPVNRLAAVLEED